MRRFFSLPTVLYGVSPSVKVLSASSLVRQSRISSSVRSGLPQKVSLPCRSVPAASTRPTSLETGLRSCLTGSSEPCVASCARPGDRPSSSNKDRRTETLISFGASTCLNCLSSSRPRSASSVILPESILSPVMARTMSPIDEAAQHGHQQVRLQAEFHRVEVLHVRLSVQQLAAVQHLAMPLGLQAVSALLRVARAPRLDAVAIQHLQRVEDGIGVLGAGCRRPVPSARCPPTAFGWTR